MSFLLQKAFLTRAEQQEIIKILRGIKPGFYTPRLHSGKAMNIGMNCFGWHWDATNYKYEKIRTDVDGQRCASIPEALQGMARRALLDTGYWPEADIRPFDILIANHYPERTGRLGLHADSSESRRTLASGYPVLSLSVGTSAIFQMGTADRSARPQDMLLESGDLLIFGRDLRLAYHGIKSMLPGTCPRELDLHPSCRLNLTFRLM